MLLYMAITYTMFGRYTIAIGNVILRIFGKTVSAKGAQECDEVDRSVRFAVSGRTFVVSLGVGVFFCECE